jgi:hypothetical protein
MKKVNPILLILLFLTCVFTLFMSGVLSAQPQQQPLKGALAILPFSGDTPANAASGGALPNLLALTGILQNSFQSVQFYTASHIANAARGLDIQRIGMSDLDTTLEIGRRLGASYILVGHITSLGAQNLVAISILNVGSQQQVAGAHQTYTGIEIVGYLSALAGRLAAQLTSGR